MKILLKDVGKRYHREWIFRHLHLELLSSTKYAIIGPNGSGKSTLLQVISGFNPLTEGHIQYINKDNPVSAENIYQHLMFTAPYLELIEEFTLLEFLRFHFNFKSLRPGYNLEQIIAAANLTQAKHKYIRNFSSGMKQRVKLSLAFYADCPVLLLDEPTTNLDQEGIDWYLDQVKQLPDDLVVIIASNQKVEYNFCDKMINLINYKN
ncbi:MAG: ABC transporter ATP-binding protein [Candidatus Cyclobacteriaceae bacterium M3_2C_046]